MWHLSSYSYSLLHLYQFRDPNLEERYRADMNRWNAYITQLHYATSVTLHVLNCASYYDTTWLSPDFWIYLFGLLNGAFFFVNGVFNPYGRRHRIIVHFVFCLINLGVALTLSYVQPMQWTARIMMVWLPEGSHLQLSGPAASSQCMDTEFEILLRSLFFKLANTFSYNDIQFMLANLCLAGLNVWSLLCYVLVLVCYVVCTATLGGLPLTYMGLMYCHGIVAYIALNVLVERVQRQKFMAETLLAEQMHAGEMADNILNHMLKNTLSDAAGSIELFLAECAPPEVLHDGLACLRRGMKACRDRQAYLKLVVGTYTPAASAVDLRELGQELLAGRPGRAEVVDLTVLMDRPLITLILDTALSNAVKHGRPGDPEVVLTIRRVDSVHPPESPGSARIEFLVSNAADPLKPPLTPTHATSLFAPTTSHPLRRVPLVSDGIGLAGCLVAAQTAGFDLSLSQEGDHVSFRAVATLRLADTCSTPGPRTLSSRPILSSTTDEDTYEMFLPEDPFPPNLHFFIMDDAAMSRRIVEHHIQRHCPLATVHVYGAEESDVELFPAVAAEHADVVVIDQHLDYRETHLGTTVVRRLLLMGYRGLVCVRSADGTPADLELYEASGAHLYIGKDVGGDEMIGRLATAYHKHRRNAGRVSTFSIH